MKYSNAVPFDDSKISIVSKEQGFDYSVENFRKYNVGRKKYIEIKGWAVEKGVVSKSTDALRVVLKDTTTEACYIIPTTRKFRADVTRSFYDGVTYDDSGFEATVNIGKGLNVNSGEYEVCILSRNKNGKKLIRTGTCVNEWMKEH